MNASPTWRLAEGGRIDRGTDLRFSFDGRAYRGHAGDTLASALLASGVRLFGRSFKYHRRRGVLSAGPEEPNALVELRGGARREPNTAATTVELFDGLEARSQNRWPSLSFDLRAANQWFSGLLGAGFYYKTFMWPAAFWEKLYEPAIRRAAGLGRAAGLADPDHYEKAYAFCDVLVIGAGPAGLAAALAAARGGARVWLVEADFLAGGRLLAEQHRLGGRPALEWVADALAELEASPNVRVKLRTTALGVYDGGVYAALERVADHLPQPAPFQPRQRLWRIVARRCVLASGAIEQPLAFADNDRPGVMLAGAARAYANRYAVRVARRLVIAGHADAGWAAARDLRAAGVEIAAIVDARPPDARGKGLRAPEGVEVINGRPLRACGRREVRGIEIALADGGLRRIDCDGIATSAGWMPALQLATHLGARPRWDGAAQCFLPGDWPAGMSGAGAVCGAFGLGAALASGANAGAEAAVASGRRRVDCAWPRSEDEPAAQAGPMRAPAMRARSFVDLQNDVTDRDLELAVREGFESSEHAKRYTTLGMATDQGKTSAVNGLAVLSAVTGRPFAATVSTTFRPPCVPVALGALAGAHRGTHFRPRRLTAAHGWAEAMGAVFIESGPWLRAQYFPRPGETDWLPAVCREVDTVRNAVGLCDVSTLGKIDLQGPDALEFLERVYANGWRTLAVGRARYGLMLREDGFVLDDGTVSRLGARHYLLTTTTANAASVYRHLQYCHQVLWPGLDLRFAAVDEHWSQFAIAGPRSRALLRAVVDPRVDLANSSFPYLAAAEIALADGTPARLFRISFSGELAYELAVPSGAARSVVERLMQAGQPLGVAPYGLEALGVLRIEKGHVAGAEINGQTTAGDLGLERMLSTRKDYVGAVLARRSGLADPSRPRLVGLRALGREGRLRGGAHLFAAGAPLEAAHDQGYVSSAAYSPTLRSWIGLGFLKGGRARIGERVRVCDPLRGEEHPAEVVDPVFVDPHGERVHA
ncbi:MAG: sarcosine oxidase subunit alpha family protein [Gammaproteobacteria bacterium]|nr:sarcosine oxidase subunit alpha family protein [Gammaproteobacteria bacterium]